MRARETVISKVMHIIPNTRMIIIPKLSSSLLYMHLSSFSSLDLYKEFQEEAYSIALHPSGLFILVGFSEKLRLMNLLIDDIRPFKEFVIRGCREVRPTQLFLFSSCL